GRCRNPGAWTQMTPSTLSRGILTALASLSLASCAGEARLAQATPEPASASATLYIDATASHVPRDPDLHALDAAMLDADGDGDLDIAVAVENGANRLYLNDGTGKLTHAPAAFG